MMDADDHTLIFDAVEFHVEYADCGSHWLRMKIRVPGDEDVLRNLRTQINLMCAAHEAEWGEEL